MQNASSAALQRYQQLADNSPQALQVRQRAEMLAASTSGASVRAMQLQVEGAAQRLEDEQLSQARSETVQRMDGEKSVRGTLDALQRREKHTPLHSRSEQAAASTASTAPTAAPVQYEGRPNNTGLPDQLKSGIESLAGMSMDHVKVRYNSDKPAQLQAHAYAQGSEIHVGPGQERHLPHEAWHLVQQAQGRVKPTLQMKGEVSVNDDVGLEREADLMGRRALGAVPMAGVNDEVGLARVTAQRVKMARLTSATSVAQRVFTYKDAELPSTWKKIPPDILPIATALMQRVRDTVGGQINEEKLEAAWNKIAKSTDKAFDIVTQADGVVKAITDTYTRSIQAQGSYMARSGQAQSLVAPLLGANPKLSFVPSARNPMVVDSSIHEVGFDEDQGNMGAQRSATHASTLILSQHGSGEEAQSSYRRDGMGLSVSTNVNAENDLLRGKLNVAQDLKTLAARVLASRNIGSMSREDAMQDVVVRHALKLYDRIADYLASDAPVIVPTNVVAEIDGLHAEIRIVRTTDWNESTSYPPTGTKLPCMGCYLYLHGEKIEVGRWMGPMWVTNAALTTQLEDLLVKNTKMGKFPASDLQQVGQNILTSYSSLPSTSHMGKGKFKSGGSGYERRADSDDEYDDAQYQHLQERVVAYNNGTPMSPQWLGSSEGWEPKEPASSSPRTETPQERFDRGLAPMTPDQARELMASLGMRTIDFVEESHEQPKGNVNMQQ